MYYKIPGGTYEDIQGYRCWIPPKPDNSLIGGYDLPRKKQMFIRTELPDYWEERYEEEQYIREQESKDVDEGIRKKVSYVDKALERFRHQEWNRRIYGYWFFNNGIPTYLTGPAYVYYNWSKLDVGYPTYYDFARKTWYFRQYCATNPTCLGYLIIGPRGTGKTSEEAVAILENITKPPHNRKAYLQSKSYEDARDTVFQGKMVTIYNTWPEFFKPTSNHGTKPETKLSFYRDTKKGKGAKRVRFGEDFELGNEVQIAPAKEKALDGRTAADVLQDEVGKTDAAKEADVYKRVQINRFCVYRNNRKVGLIRATSTVEEMEAGGAECEKIWKNSDPDNLTANGFTTTGLLRYFISAKETATQFVDDYGFIDEKKAVSFHTAERESREYDEQELSSYIRKNPFTPEEAFIKDAAVCQFNTFILTQTRNKLNTIPKNQQPFTVGNLDWVDSVDGDVEFTRDPRGGRFKFTWFPDKQYLNKLRKNWNGIWEPVNDDKWIIGTDPIKFIKSDDPRSSKAGVYAFRLFDPSVDMGKDKKDWLSHNFFVQYLYRPDEPETYFEDMIKLVKYLGCSILPEYNVDSLGKHFKSRGYYSCLLWAPNIDDEIVDDNTPEKGLTSTDEIIDAGIRLLKSFVNNHGHRIPFIELVDQMLDFDISKRTKYDAVMAAIYTMIATRRKVESEPEEIDSSQWFVEYDASGNRSQPLLHDS